MVKRNFIALGMAAAIAASAVTGCSADNGASQEASVSQTAEESSSAQETASSVSEESADQETVSLDSILNDIKEAYGESYAPDMEIDAQMLEDMTGITADLYESYVAEMPMISTFVETFIGIQAKDDTADQVEEDLNAYRDKLVNDTMQYPMNISKIQASQVVRHGNFVFFVMLGAADDAALEEGDEAALVSAQENNQIAIDIINGYFE